MAWISAVPFYGPDAVHEGAGITGIARFAPPLGKITAIERIDLPA